jgi:hypothetical protein
MSISSREELIQWSLRALGHPVININVTEEQLNDRLDDSLELFQEYHLEANERTYLKYKVQAEDVYNQFIPIDGSRVLGITRIIPASYLMMSKIGDDLSQMPFDLFSIMSQGGMGFGSSGGGMSSIDLTTYTMFRQFAETINLLLMPDPSIRYKRYSNRLYIDGRWQAKTSDTNILTEQTGGEILAESDDSEGPVEETDNIMFESEFIGGTNRGRHQINEDDWIIIECHKFLDPEECPGIYGDRFLKEHYKANVKYQFGQNISKFSTLTLPGGVQLNGDVMKQEAQAELDKMRQELQDFYVEPARFFIG